VANPEQRDKRARETRQRLAGGTTTEVILAVVFLTCGVMAFGILSVLNPSRHSS